MSRCFPFPPPGYERKARVDDANLLTKEKEKEKTHKKEKKENKEKNDKDRSKEKKREKDRKEKYKNKDRDKEDRTRNSDEKRANNQMSFPNEQKFGSNTLQSNKNKDTKFVQDLARRISDENKVSGSQMPRRNVATDQRGTEFFPKAVQPGIVKQSVGKESVMVKADDHRKVNGQRNNIYDRGLEKAFDEISNLDKERFETISRPAEKESDMQVERKEKTKNKDGHVKGQSNKDREKDSKSKDKDTNKEKKKKEKAKEINDVSKDQLKAREGGPRLKESSEQSLDSQDSKPQKAVQLSFPNLASDGNVGKRKECEINGYITDNRIQPNKLPKLLSTGNGIQPNKLPRPLSASPLANENGRKLDSSQAAIQFGAEKPVPTNNNKMDSKERKINGLIPSQRNDVRSSVPVPPKVLLSQNGEASLKPPHPDTKYLSQILSVPIVGELADFDDHEWLLSSNMQLKQPDMTSPQIDDTRQVWAEARWIESADISALPYVIPY